MKGDYENVPLVIRDYGIESGKIWQELRADMPKGLVD
jgi:GntR family negative regulator for fad regulon and positive regulator of fabA